MKSTILFTLLSMLLLSSCGFDTEKIKGHAVIVDNFTDRNLLEGIYIEITQTNDEGYTYEIVDGVS